VLKTKKTGLKFSLASYKLPRVTWAHRQCKWNAIVESHLLYIVWSQKKVSRGRDPVGSEGFTSRN